MKAHATENNEETEESKEWIEEKTEERTDDDTSDRCDSFETELRTLRTSVVPAIDDTCSYTSCAPLEDATLAYSRVKAAATMVFVCTQLLQDTGDPTYVQHDHPDFEELEGYTQASIEHFNVEPIGLRLQEAWALVAAATQDVHCRPEA